MHLAGKKLSDLLKLLEKPGLSIAKRLKITEKIAILNKTISGNVDKNKEGRDQLVSHDCSDSSGVIKIINLGLHLQ